MITHEVKCWPEYFDRLLNGDKPFELRKNDRDYQTGDKLHVFEYDNSDDVPVGVDRYTERSAMFDITYVLKGPCFGLAEGWAILGLKKEEPRHV